MPHYYRMEAKKGDQMNVNGVTGVAIDGYSYSTAARKIDKKSAEEYESTSSEGVVYEPSDEAGQINGKIQPYNKNDVIAKIKADNDARVNQLQNIVNQLITKQATAYGSANDIWSFLREGNFTVDPETKAQAQADIAEDGYWGVKQTSNRIVDFAIALAGNDNSKLEKMRDAFLKGYEQAEKTWGGKLPEISQKTYDAVMEKFDNLLETEAE